MTSQKFDQSKLRIRVFLHGGEEAETKLKNWSQYFNPENGYKYSIENEEALVFEPTDEARIDDVFYEIERLASEDCCIPNSEISLVYQLDDSNEYTRTLFSVEKSGSYPVDEDDDPIYVDYDEALADIMQNFDGVEPEEDSNELNDLNDLADKFTQGIMSEELSDELDENPSDIDMEVDFSEEVKEASPSQVKKRHKRVSEKSLKNLKNQDLEYKDSFDHEDQFDDEPSDSNSEVIAESKHDQQKSDGSRNRNAEEITEVTTNNSDIPEMSKTEPLKPREDYSEIVENKVDSVEISHNESEVARVVESLVPSNFNEIDHFKPSLEVDLSDIEPQYLPMANALKSQSELALRSRRDVVKDNLYDIDESDLARNKNKLIESLEKDFEGSNIEEYSKLLKSADEFELALEESKRQIKEAYKKDMDAWIQAAIPALEEHYRTTENPDRTDEIIHEIELKSQQSISEIESRIKDLKPSVYGTIMSKLSKADKMDKLISSTIAFIQTKDEIQKSLTRDLDAFRAIHPKPSTENSPEKSSSENDIMNRFSADAEESPDGEKANNVNLETSFDYEDSNENDVNNHSQINESFQNGLDEIETINNESSDEDFKIAAPPVNPIEEAIIDDELDDLNEDSENDEENAHSVEDSEDDSEDDDDSEEEYDIDEYGFDDDDDDDEFDEDEFDDDEDDEDDDDEDEEEEYEESASKKANGILNKVLIGVGGLAAAGLLVGGSIFAWNAFTGDDSPETPSEVATQTQSDNSQKGVFRVGDSIKVASEGQIIQVNISEFTEDGAIAQDSSGQKYMITQSQLESYAADNPDQFAGRQVDSYSNDAASDSKNNQNDSKLRNSPTTSVAPAQEDEVIEAPIENEDAPMPATSQTPALQPAPVNQDIRVNPELPPAPEELTQPALEELPQPAEQVPPQTQS